MGPATIGYMIGSFVGALFFTGIVVAVSRSIRASLSKLLIAVAVLTVASIIAEYYGSADGVAVDFPPPLEWFFSFEASVRLATFGAAFFVFSLPVLTGFWRKPGDANQTYGASNLRISYLALPIACASSVPLIWYFYENQPPKNGLEVYEAIAPRTMELLDELDPGFRERAEESIGLHRLRSQVFDPRSEADFAAEVGVVAAEVQALYEGRADIVLRAPAEVQGDVLRALADGAEWFAENQQGLCVDFLQQGWAPFVDTFAPESHSLLDSQLRATVNAVVPNWTGQTTPEVKDDDLFRVGHIWATEIAPALGYSKDRAIVAAEAFDKILVGEPIADCQGFADILRMIAAENDLQISRIRAALAQAYVSTE